MDKKNFILGILCLSVAMFLMHQQGKVAQQQVVKQTSSSNVIVKPSLAKNAIAEESSQTKPVISEAILAPEQTVLLENDSVRISFTTHGGAIRAIELKKYPAESGKTLPYVFNQESSLPALGLALNEPLNTLNYSYTVVQKTENFVQFSYKDMEGTEIIRGFQLANNGDKNPYIVRHETLIRSKNLPIKNLFFNLGTFPATPGDTYGEYLNFGFFNGKKAEFIKTRDFSASNGFLGLGKREARQFVYQEPEFIQWGSVKNQFFTAILTPNDPANTFFAQPLKFNPDKGSKSFKDAINGLLGFSCRNVSENIFSMQYYVGPKDFFLLNQMGKEQDLVMEFGFFGSVSKILLLTMLGIHHFVPNWGWTIILLTIFIKLLMWPLTGAQVRSAKRMSAIQKPMQEIREKFKNNPQKLQSETMKLFKEHKVNPAMGCLPLLVQLPIFIGLYVMLRTSSEMRFQKFLWIKDLSIPDTIAHLGAFPINILPLLMGVTMFLQMRLTPTPTTDNAQQKMLQWMPFIFLIFCYNFPAALVLYWTIQNVLTIVQQVLTSKTAGAALASESVAGSKSRKKIVKK